MPGPIAQSYEPVQRHIYLVEAFLGATASPTASIDLAQPNCWTANCMLANQVEGENYGGRLVRVSDQGYTTPYNDLLLPNVYYDGIVESPGLLQGEASLAPEQPSQLSRTFGQIILANHDGAWDTFFENAPMQGRRIRILYGLPEGQYNSFLTIADMIGIDYTLTNEACELLVRDAVFNYTEPLFMNRYLGTGGSEGTPALEGVLKPLAYGAPMNIRPVLVDPFQLTYQVNDGQIEAIDFVYDQGLALSFQGDYATYQDLVNATISSGFYGTCLAEGYFKLGSNPIGIVTADILGDKEGGVYVSTAVDIALRLMDRYTGNTPPVIDTAAWNAFDTLYPYQIGLYIADQQPTIEEAVNACVISLGAFWGPQRDGDVTVFRLEAPDAPDLAVDISDIISVDRLPMPEALRTPNAERKVNYLRNWAPLSATDIAAGVDPTRRAFLEREYATVTKLREGATVFQELTYPPATNTLLTKRPEAEAVAQHWINLHGVDRRMFSITMKSLGYDIYLGSDIQVTWPRYGLENGWTGRVVAIQQDYRANEVDITLWG